MTWQPIESAPLRCVDLEESVRCNKCGWTGAEYDLVRANDSEDGEITSAACPTCLTDHYLIDLPRYVTAAALLMRSE